MGGPSLAQHHCEISRFGDCCNCDSCGFERWAEGGTMWEVLCHQVGKNGRRSGRNGWRREGKRTGPSVGFVVHKLPWACEKGGQGPVTRMALRFASLADQQETWKMNSWYCMLHSQRNIAWSHYRCLAAMQFSWLVSTKALLTLNVGSTSTASHSSEVVLAFCGDFVSSTLAQSGFALLVWPAFS